MQMNRLAAKSFLAKALALVAVLAAGLLPQGIMPSRSANGMFELVICTDQGESRVWIDASGKQSPTAPPEHPDSLCPWATTGHLTILAASAALPDSAIAPVAIDLHCGTSLIASEMPCRDSAPRGPPILI
jgi:hypothetical protein